MVIRAAGRPLSVFSLPDSAWHEVRPLCTGAESSDQALRGMGSRISLKKCITIINTIIYDHHT
jgi:hypothetical protein